MGYNRNLDRQNAVSQSWWERNWPTFASAIIVALFGVAYMFTYYPQVFGSPASYSTAEVIKSIYWSDGDSGRIIFDNGDVFPFRLNNIDAPETGGVGAAIGGAKCEAEREMGFESKAWAAEYTRDAKLEITGDYGSDRHDRKIIDLSANGQDVGSLGIRLGRYRSWRHDRKKALELRPLWCSES